MPPIKIFFKRIVLQELLQNAEPNEGQIRETITSFNFALIGWYLQKYGMLNTFEFIEWLGIPIRTDNKTPLNFFAAPKSPASHSPDEHCKLNRLLDGYDTVEKMLLYNFCDKTYLLQAFSHESFSSNDICPNYKSLDFVGDAILNYIIVRHLFRDPRFFSAIELKHITNLLISNSNYATVSMRHQLHKYLRHTVPSIRSDIARFAVLFQRNRGKPIDDVRFDCSWLFSVFIFFFSLNSYT